MVEFTARYMPYSEKVQLLRTRTAAAAAAHSSQPLEAPPPRSLHFGTGRLLLPVLAGDGDALAPNTIDRVAIPVQQQQ